VALSDLTPMALEQTAAAVRTLGGHATCHVADPSKGLAARMLLDEALAAWDGLDILVLHPRAEPRYPLLVLDEWDWQRTLETNLNGPFLLQQLAGNWLHSEGREGVMINLITGGLNAPAQPERAAAYISQMGLRALTQAAAGELSAHGIRLYGIALEDFSPARLVEAAQVGVSLCTGEIDIPSGTIFELSSPGGKV
jgi:NAD(P)-dependent dehydrogenase (short-subunit alcohol dehydrogenase family)